MNKIIVSAGDRYSRLVIQKELPSPTRYRIMLVMCDCGTSKSVYLNDMRSGKTTSCGCYMKQRIAETHTIHNLSGTCEYRAWWDMIARCTDEGHKHYSRYGGRGIKVYEKWMGSFEIFLKDVGFRPNDSECIDRVDNEQGYYPGNVRWTTMKINAGNTSKSKYWWITGIRYNTVSDAALANNVSCETIGNWCNGYKDYKTGKIYPPKKGCKSENKYTIGA